ncbi:MAG: hypothetical protein H7838_05700 [Magnetococcus sp. DMHC-8]
MFSSFALWLDQLSWTPLLVGAILLALAPFVPEPHLWEKLKMLMAGTLSRPLDIFDLCMHAAPLLLVLFKWWRQTGAVVVP